MRCCWSSAARVLTLFSFALLSSQSLLLVAAQKTDVIDIPKQDEGGSPTPISPAPTNTSPSSPSSPTTTSIPPEVTTPSTTPSSTPSRTRPSTSSTSTSTPAPAQETSTTQTPTSSPTSTTIAPAPLATETSSSSSSSASSSSSSSLASSTSSSLVITTTSSSPGVTLVSQTGTTLVATATTNALATDDSATSYTWSVSPSSTATDAAVPAGASKSFFDNKGAVAGTFTAAGAAVIGIIVIAVVVAKRRAARLQDEEDMTYFEKYEGPNSTNGSAIHDGSRTPTDPEASFVGLGGAHGMDVNDEPVATHAAPDAYPDRSMHFGLPTMEEYAQPQAMGIDFNSAVDYPPGMSYDPTQYAGYEGYNSAQYAGYDGYNSAQNAGYENAYAQPQQPYYAASYPPQSVTPHPYANPTNSPRVAGAPPVQQLYGEAQ